MQPLVSTCAATQTEPARPAAAQGRSLAHVAIPAGRPRNSLVGGHSRLVSQREAQGRNHTAGMAVWYHSGMPSVPLCWVLIRDPEGEFKTQALLCTDRWADPVQVITWFVQRWQLEVTFEEVRAHLGVETQRQWADAAIARVTPALLGLFSWITLAADKLQTHNSIPVRTAAWYTKPLPTFSDAIAAVRRELWPVAGSCSMSPARPDIANIPRALLDRLLNTVCYAT